jgi:predicted metalloprotease with PDZ domain
VAGTDLGAFFDDYVRGTAPLELTADLAFVGLQLVVQPSKSSRDLARDGDGFPLEPTLGVTTRSEGALCKVIAVLEGGPADAAGINPDDVLLAVDSMRVTHATLQERLDLTRGEPVELSFYRGQELRRLVVRPALERLEDWKLVPVEAPDEAQHRAFRDWTGHELPERRAAAADGEGVGDGEGESRENGADG